MKIPAELWSNPRPDRLVDVLERRQLDQAAIPHLPLFGQVDGTDLVRLVEIGRFGSPDEAREADGPSSHDRVEDLLGGLYGLGVTVAYLLVGQPNEVAVYLGLRGGARYGTQGHTLLHSALGGLFPHVRLDDSSSTNQRLGRKLKRLGHFSHQGIVTGIPTLKRSTEKGPPICPWDRLLRALRGQAWGCFALARPVEIDRIVQMARAVSQGRRLYSFHAGEQMQKGPGVTVEVEGGPAHDALEGLERLQERLNVAKAEGMWDVAFHFFSPSQVTVRQMASLLRGAFAGQDSRPEPIRTFVCSPGEGGSSHQPTTLLTSRELAIVAQLPQEEQPGYMVREMARFDTALGKHATRSAVTLGPVLSGTRDTGNTYAIERSDLAKHALVTGVTGSGKTNTCFHLLDQVWQRSRGAPFLVIEPAKTEYRDLLEAKDGERRFLFPGLRVFTLGEERIAPFRLNPFEFEVFDEEHGVHVQTHIDHLKSVFNASFILYAPMPYVLERCLHEVYQDRGWDLASSVNRRVPDAGGPLPPEVFPTLSDLYDKVGEVVDALGYEERIRMDVRAALETRVNSLRIGGKGLMLDTRQSVPMEELLTRPTVLELEGIGNDDEKAFVIGLLLTRLYEHRVIQAKQLRTRRRKPAALQHVTVIEEAHRLLRRVSSGPDPEAANTQGQAVETFANMLAEIRAYGEGVVVAEQIPAKLAPDVVKNTNLKVLHRLVAEDDRRLVGSTMNLDEAQTRFVATLNVGQAAVFAERDDRPFLVGVKEHPATESRGRVADQDVVASMESFCTSDVYDPYRACASHCRALSNNAGRCPHYIRDQARSIVERASVQDALAVWLLSTVEDTEQFTGAYPLLRGCIRRSITARSRHEDDIILCAVIQGVDRLFERKMRRYDWLLNVTTSLKSWLLAAAAGLVHEYEEGDPRSSQSVLEQWRDELNRFSKGYRQQCKRAIGPYLGCEACRRRCLYLDEVQRVVKEHLFRERLLQALRGEGPLGDETAGAGAMWHRVWGVCLDAARQVIVTEDEDVLASVALCYAAQVGPALGFSPMGQRRLVDGVSRLL